MNSSTIASTLPSYHPLNKAPAYNLLFLICLQLYNYCHHSEGEDYHMFLIWFSWAFLCLCLSTLLHSLTIETNHSSLHQLDVKLKRIAFKSSTNPFHISSSHMIWMKSQHIHLHRGKVWDHHKTYSSLLFHQNMVQNIGTIHPSYHLLNIDYLYLISFIDYIFPNKGKQNYID